MRFFEIQRPTHIRLPDGKLGVLLFGLGAVATTTIVGILLGRCGLGDLTGSLTQCATIRLGERTEDRSPLIRDFLPMAGLKQLVVGAWDLFPEDAYHASEHAQVLEKRHLEPIRDELSAIKPYRGAFCPEYVKLEARRAGPHLPAQALPSALWQSLPQSTHQLLPAAR